jgi:hypothetical protein
MSDPIAPSPSADAPAAPPTSVEFKLHDDVRVDPVDWAARAAAVRTGLVSEGLPASDMFGALNAFRFLDDAGATWTYNGSDWSTWNGTSWVAGTPPAELKLQPFKLDLVPDAPDSAPTLPSPRPATAPLASPQPATATPVPPVQGAPVSSPVVQPAPAPVPAAAPLLASPAVVPQPTPSPTTQQQQPSPTPQPALAPPPRQPLPMPATYRPSHVVPRTGVPAWSQPDPRTSPVTQLAPGLDVMVVEWQPTGWARIVCSNQWSGWVDGRYLVPIGR